MRTTAQRRAGWALALGSAVTAVAGSYSAISDRVTVDTRSAAVAATNTLVLTVRSQSADAVLPGATVVVGGVTRTTDVNGRVTIAPATNGAALTIFKSGYQTNDTACDLPGSGTFAQTERLASLLGTSLKPAIKSAKVRPFAFALQATGLDIPLHVVSGVNWGPGTGGKVKYSTAVKSGSVDRGSPTTTLRLNPTTDLPCSGLPVPRNYTIRLTAET